MSDQAFNDWYDRYFDEAIEKYAGLDTTNPKGIAQDAWEAAIEAALQSQDLEDALRYRWIFTADMDEQTITFATLNACVALRSRVKAKADEAIDHARRVEGDK